MRELELHLVAECHRRCAYCPQDVCRGALAKHGITDNMTVAELLAILHHASEGGPLTVTLAGFAEPMQHPDFFTFVRRIYNRTRRIRLFTTGDFLDAADIPWLALRTDMVRIHVCSLDAPVWRHVERVKRIRNFQFVVIKDPRNEEFKAIRKQLRDMGVKPLVIAMDHRCGHVEPQELTTCPVRCTKKAPIAFPTGLTISCCNDFAMETVLGNLVEQPWSQLRHDWLKQQQQTPSDMICFRNCVYAARMEAQ